VRKIRKILAAIGAAFECNKVSNGRNANACPNGNRAQHRQLRSTQRSHLQARLL